VRVENHKGLGQPASSFFSHQQTDASPTFQFLPLTMVDILDPSAVLSRLVSLLPESSTLNSPQDGLVALIHSCMTILSFRLVGIDDSNTTNVYENNVLPSNWNSNGPGSYTLRCRHEQSSLEFILKVSKLGSRTVINAIAAEVSYDCIFIS